MAEFRVDDIGGGYVATKPTAVPPVAIGAGRGKTLTAEDKHILHTGADPGTYTLYPATGSGNIHTLSRAHTAAAATLVAVGQDRINTHQRLTLTRSASVTVQDVGLYKWVIK